MRGIFRGVLTALVAAALLAPAWTPGLKAASHYADERPGEVSFAVRTERDVWGRALDRQVQSASVVKALLLVAYLRRPDVRSRDLTGEERHILSPMIRRSSNRAASTVVLRLGRRRSTAPRIASGCGASTSTARSGAGSLITAREESRFFLHIGERLPPRHRAWGWSCCGRWCRSSAGGSAR